MKMNKELLNEIFRIQELLGVKKNILNESTPIIKFLSDLAQDFIVTSKKAIQGVADEVMVGSIQVEKRVLQNLIDALQNPALFDALDDAEKAILGRILAQSQEIVNDTYQKLFGDLINSRNISEKQLISFINDETTGADGQPAKSISEILNEMYENNPFITTLLTRKVYNKVTQFKAGNFIEEVTLKPKVGDDIAQIIQKRGKEIPRMTASKDIDWINKFFSSNKTVLNLVRRTANSALLRYEKRLLGNEEFIKKTFQDILRTTNKINNNLKGDVSKIDSNEILTELRNISSKIKVVQDTYKTDIDALYKEIETSLTNNITDAKTKELIPEFMKKLKEVDPFAVGNWEQKSYALKFLNSTATQQTLNNIGRILKNTIQRKKEVWGEIKQLASRLPAFLATGAPKTLEDVQSYFVKYGDVKGLVYLTRDIWLASHIGVPLTMAAVDTLYNLVLLGFTPISGVPRETIWNDYVTSLNDDFMSQYKGMRGVYDEDEMNLVTIAYGLLPGHAYGWDFGKWLVGIGNKAERGELRPQTNIPKQIEDIFEKYKIPKSTQDSMMKAIQNAPTADSAAKMVEDAMQTLDPSVMMKKFENFIKSDKGDAWGKDYTGQKLGKEGNYYTITDWDNIIYDYEYVKDEDTFKQIKH